MFFLSVEIFKVPLLTHFTLFGACVNACSVSLGNLCFRLRCVCVPPLRRGHIFHGRHVLLRQLSCWSLLDKWVVCLLALPR